MPTPVCSGRAAGDVGARSVTAVIAPCAPLRMPAPGLGGPSRMLSARAL